MLFISSVAHSAAGVVGGIKLNAPWVVRMEIFGKVHCTGSIIAPQWIITAAHCFYGLNINPSLVRLGGGGDGNLSGLHTLPAIDTIILHPQYRGPRTVARDVALVKLVSPIQYQASLGEIGIKNISQMQAYNLQAHIVGWGKKNAQGEEASELRGFTTWFYRTEFMSPTNPARQILFKDFRAPNILAFDGSTNTTCGGDSGTGWTADFPNEGRKLIAIHSQGDCRSFGASAELSGLIPWIRETLADHL